MNRITDKKARSLWRYKRDKKHKHFNQTKFHFISEIELPPSSALRSTVWFVSVPWTHTNPCNISSFLAFFLFRLSHFHLLLTAAQGCCFKHSRHKTLNPQKHVYYFENFIKFMPNKRHCESKAKSNVCLPFKYDSLNGTTSIRSMTYQLLWQHRALLSVTYWSRQNKVILMIKRNLEINIKQGLILSLGEKPYNMRFPLNLPRWKHSTVLRRTNTSPAVNILS